MEKFARKVLAEVEGRICVTTEPVTLRRDTSAAALKLGNIVAAARLAGFTPFY